MFRFSDELVLAWHKTESDKDRLIAQAAGEALRGKLTRKSFIEACRKDGLTGNTTLFQFAYSQWQIGDNTLDGIAVKVSEKRHEIAEKQHSKRMADALKKAVEASAAKDEADKAAMAAMNPELAGGHAADMRKKHIAKMSLEATKALLALKAWREMANMLTVDSIPVEQLEEITKLVTELTTR